MLWRLGPVSLSDAQAGLGRDRSATPPCKPGSTGWSTRGSSRAPPIGRPATRPPSRPRRSAPAISICCVERVSGGSVVPLVAHLVRDRALSAGRHRRAQTTDRRGRAQRPQNERRPQTVIRLRNRDASFCLEHEHERRRFSHRACAYQHLPCGCLLRGRQPDAAVSRHLAGRASRGLDSGAGRGLDLLSRQRRRAVV